MRNPPIRTKASQPSLLASTVVMVSPASFGYNFETSASNPFQQKKDENKYTSEEIQRKAKEEFTQMVKTLRLQDIRILILESLVDVITPDSIFPNNWFSHDENGTLIIYPMLTQNRRAERQTHNLITLLQTHGISVTNVIDLSPLEKKRQILEGTGSMVLDRKDKVAFALESPRTVKETFFLFCKKMEYKPILFHAYDKHGIPIYHTNVFMCIGREFAVVCLDAIKETTEREMIQNELKRLNKTIIAITMDQLYSFCGNILQVSSQKGRTKIVMSQSAFSAFTENQKKQLTTFGELIPVTIPTIEYIGGGSARCMLAEVF